MYEDKDYILRLIKDIIRMIMKLVFGKDIEDLKSDDLSSEAAEAYETFQNMIENGHIEAAEDLLFESLDIENDEYLKIALLFYYLLNEKTEEFLVQHNFSKQEVIDGLKYVTALYGHESMVALLDETDS